MYRAVYGYTNICMIQRYIIHCFYNLLSVQITAIVQLSLTIEAHLLSNSAA